MNKRDIKKNNIIQAAAVSFAEKGYSGTLMSDIAKLAGIGKGTLYEYFSSKEDLFFGVFEWFTEEMKSSATVGISDLAGTAAQRLRAMSNAIVAAWEERRELFTLVMEFWSASAASTQRERFKKAFQHIYQDFRMIVEAILKSGKQKGEFGAGTDIKAVAAALVGTWDALFLQAWFDPGFDLQAVCSGFLEVLINGLTDPAKGGGR